MAQRFGSPKLEAELDGVRLLDVACAHFREAGLAPVIYAGRGDPSDPEIIVADPGAEMINTLRNGLRHLPFGPAAFAPADMPALTPDLIRSLVERFAESGAEYLVPVHEGRRGHPAFARSLDAFFRLGDHDGAREVWREAGDAVLHVEVDTADILFDVDTPADLASAGSAESRRARLIARGDL